MSVLKKVILNIPIKSHHPNIRPEHQEKLEQRELWHKLVVKIINWQGAGADSLMTKISLKEWSKYCERMIIIGVTKGREKTMEGLEETRKTIKSHGGFE